MPVDFYNVKSRQKESIADDKVTKIVYERQTKDGSTQYRYALKAVAEDGTKLTKFVSKDTWDAHPGEVESNN